MVCPEMVQKAIMQFTALYSRREGTTRTDISFTALETVLDKPANAAPPHRSFADRETCCIRTCLCLGRWGWRRNSMVSSWSSTVAGRQPFQFWNWLLDAIGWVSETPKEYFDNEMSVQSSGAQNRRVTSPASWRDSAWYWVLLGAAGSATQTRYSWDIECRIKTNRLYIYIWGGFV